MILNSTTRALRALGSLTLSLIVLTTGCTGADDSVGPDQPVAGASIADRTVSDAEKQRRERRANQLATRSANPAAAQPAPVPVANSTPPVSTALPANFDSDANFAPIGAAYAGLPASTATQAAQTSNLCTTQRFPAQWEWGPNVGAPSPQPATLAEGKPLIRQYRGGKLIATYDKLGSLCRSQLSSTNAPDTSCGAFRRAPYRNWEPGDVFELYPAIYEGPDQQAFIGPMFATDAEYNAGQFMVPKDITIRGVTVNGKRPVLRVPGTGTGDNTLGQSLIYLDKSENITIENLDIDGSGGAFVGKAAIYLNGVHNLTVRDVKIYGFKDSDANGIFSTERNSGVIRLDRVELHDNGGASGPEHNIYINASASDPNFTVWMTNSFSHSVYYGHTFKSRAQVNILEGNYFMGTKAGARQAEAFLVDIPNGGRLFMRNNILAKNASGDNSNGVFMTFADEGVTDSRAMSARIEHNTFVAFTRFFDSQLHPLSPLLSYYPMKYPDAPGFPVAKWVMQHNVFVGFCDSPNYPRNYYGRDALRADFADLNPDFTLKNKQAAGSATSVAGSPAYAHPLQPARRTANTIGARD